MKLVMKMDIGDTPIEQELEMPTGFPAMPKETQDAILAAALDMIKKTLRLELVND